MKKDSNDVYEDVAAMDYTKQPATVHIENTADDNLVAVEASQNVLKLTDLKWSTWGAVLAMFVTSFGTNSSYILIMNTTAAVGAAYHDTTTVSWYGTAYGLAQVSALLFAFSLSDIMGRKPFFIIGLVISIAGHVVGLAGHNGTHVIVACALMGFASGMTGISAAALPEILPNKFKPLASGIQEMAAALWAIFGGLFGYLLASAGWARLDFLFGAVLHSIALALIVFLYFPPENPIGLPGSKWEQARHLDYVGILTLVSSMLLLLVSINLGGGTYGWHSPMTWGLFAGSLGLLSITVAWEWAGKCKLPIVPRVLFKYKRNYVCMLVCAFASGYCLMVQVVLWPYLCTHLWTQDPIKIGLMVIPSGVGMLVGNVGISYFTRFIKRTDLQLSAAFALSTACVGLLGVLNANNMPGGLALSFFIGAFISMLLVLVTVQVVFAIPQEHLGAGMGLCGAIRSIGGTVGMTIWFSLMYTKLGQETYQVIDAVIAQGVNATQAALIAGAAINGGAPAVVSLGFSDAVASAIDVVVKGVWHDVFRLIGIVAASMTGMGFICSLAARDVFHLYNDGRAVNLDAGDARHREVVKGTIEEQVHEADVRVKV